MNITIISASVRTGRNSHRVALYLKNYLTATNIATVNILDLNEFKFPVFEERLQYLPNPSAQILKFTEGVKQADGIIIVTPEYNGGYPASLKNVIDLLYVEWKKKPVALATVSAGPFGGAQVTTALLFPLWKIGAWVVPAMFPTPKVQEAFDEQGNATDKAATDKRVKPFIEELVWCVEARKKMTAVVS